MTAPHVADLAVVALVGLFGEKAVLRAETTLASAVHLHRAEPVSVGAAPVLGEFGDRGDAGRKTRQANEPVRV